MLSQDKRLTEVVQRFNGKNWKKICEYAMSPLFNTSYLAINFLNIFGPSLMPLHRISFFIRWILLSGKLVPYESIFALWTVTVLCFFSMLSCKDQFGLWKLLYILIIWCYLLSCLIGSNLKYGSQQKRVLNLVHVMLLYF